MCLWWPIALYFSPFHKIPLQKTVWTTIVSLYYYSTATSFPSSSSHFYPFFTMVGSTKAIKLCPWGGIFMWWPMQPHSTKFHWQKRCETAFSSIFRVKFRAPRLRGKGPHGKKTPRPGELKKRRLPSGGLLKEWFSSNGTLRIHLIGSWASFWSIWMSDWPCQSKSRFLP